MTSWENDLLTELETIGEAEVRNRLARGEFGMVGSSKSTTVKAWLYSKESDRCAARETKAFFDFGRGLFQGAHSRRGGRRGGISFS